MSYEKSCENSRIVQEILRDPMANYWGAEMHNPYVLRTVNKNSLEFSRVEGIFNQTARGLEISILQRVENPYLLGQYSLKKKKLSDKYGFVRELSLFHGTRQIYIDGICKSNFDWRRCGNSRGHKFGRGVSFAPEVSYARHYTFGDNVMFLSKVLVCNSIIGNVSTTVPPELYDTTTNARNTVYVKYEDDDFYPQYVIHYTTFDSALRDILQKMRTMTDGGSFGIFD
ncbi:protein mono-ADP-ribosyltransferase PARP12-like [Tribolium madens]|uniref:protein mono-ADP-ribosyltransferase PARP12-like n=1 Tax=Tribolium madens TaxID=41895 RepID=UPI001CF733D0|nr:protein mono-ADP-ribosyltransferase PARP12-like [Tribolium madens]